jgi:DNA-binding NarL/FixJ family response regulator
MTWLMQAPIRAGDGSAVAQLVDELQDDDPLEELTPRQREVLALMAEGLSNDAICARLVLSPKTVETHVSGIFWKLGLLPAPGCHRRVRAVLTFLAASPQGTGTASRNGGYAVVGAGSRSMSASRATSIA